jgi:hypothetical protein
LISFAISKQPPIGTGGQSYKLWDKSQKISLIPFTGAKIAFFWWTGICFLDYVNAYGMKIRSLKPVA